MSVVSTCIVLVKFQLVSIHKHYAIQFAIQADRAKQKIISNSPQAERGKKPWLASFEGPQFESGRLHVDKAHRMNLLHNTIILNTAFLSSKFSSSSSRYSRRDCTTAKNFSKWRRSSANQNMPFVHRTLGPRIQ